VMCFSFDALSDLNRASSFQGNTPPSVLQSPEGGQAGRWAKLAASRVVLPIVGALLTAVSPSPLDAPI